MEAFQCAKPEPRLLVYIRNELMLIKHTHVNYIVAASVSLNIILFIRRQVLYQDIKAILISAYVSINIFIVPVLSHIKTSKQRDYHQDSSETLTSPSSYLSPSNLGRFGVPCRHGRHWAKTQAIRRDYWMTSCRNQ